MPTLGSLVKATWIAFFNIEGLQEVQKSMCGPLIPLPTKRLSGEHCGKLAANPFQQTFTMQMSLPQTFTMQTLGEELLVALTLPQTSFA